MEKKNISAPLKWNFRFQLHAKWKILKEKFVTRLNSVVPAFSFFFYHLLFFPLRPPTVYKHFMLFKEKGNYCGNVEKKDMLPSWITKTLYWMKIIVLLAELWDWSVLSCCDSLIIYIFFLCVVLSLFISWTIEVCMFFLCANNCSLSCTYTKRGSCLRKTRVPEYQLHTILMFILFLRKENWLRKLSTEGYGFQRGKKILNVSKSIAVTFLPNSGL